MEALVLFYRGRPLREYPIDSRPLEVGRSTACDIVVHDPEVADRELLIAPSAGTVVAYCLKGPKEDRGAATSLAPYQPIAVGRDHALVRISQTDDTDGSGTAPLRIETAPKRVLRLLIGRGPEARSVVLGSAPLTVGTAPTADIQLADRTVSAFHVRLDPMPGGVVVRDLGSKNGTWIDGMRVGVAHVLPGALLRLGKTDLQVAAAHPGSTAGTFVANSAGMVRVLGEVERYARLTQPVLVRAESGAGKERVARALHDLSARSKGPFVALNAGAFARDLIESELFGHQRGAFTGAQTSHRGVFEQADGGTLFLDEIGELPLELQSRLLRVLETWEVRRVGSEAPISVEVRLVTATHADLFGMVERGAFRLDLYYRLSPLVLEIPPLRDRPEDLPELVEHFLQELAPELGPRRMSTEGWLVLRSHPFYGNVRELRNVLVSAAASSSGPSITVDDLTQALRRLSGAPGPRVSGESIEKAVELHAGNLTAAARALGIPRSTLRDRLRSTRALKE